MVGADSGGGGGVTRSSSASSSSSSQQQGSFKLYRRESDDDEEPAHTATADAPSKNRIGGLFDRMMSNGGSNEGLVISHDVSKGGIDKYAIDKKGPLPAPPSALLKGFISGIGGYIASSVEKVINDDDEYSNNNASGAMKQRESSGGGLQLYRRDDGK